MSLYRKKPVVIEAELFDRDKKYKLSDAFRAAICACGATGSFETETPWHIHTLEGAMIASDGDYIIKGIKGEFYPCKTDIFAASYERVEEPAA